jgi:hypothetical protein
VWPVLEICSAAAKPIPVLHPVINTIAIILLVSCLFSKIKPVA